MSTRILDIAGLNVRFATADGEVAAVSDVSLHIDKGECLGIVGESGSGKSQTFMAVMGLLAANGRATGSAVFGGVDLLKANQATLNAIRGNRLSMVFQDPMTSLTPHMRIGRQLTEVLERHRGLDGAAARRGAVTMLGRVQVPEPERRMAMYPHELSGGLRQRVVLAMALLCGPELVIADEPTTALDVTVQALILDLIRELKEQHGTSFVLITHDLGVVAGLADRVAVMYAGRIVENGTAQDIFAAPRHPYTKGLLACTPRLDDPPTAMLPTIPGQPPNLHRLPTGCAFHPRCEFAFAPCPVRRPLLVPAGNTINACFLNHAQAAP
ncbi:MAG: ABC transporter ATP-binding protein [Rhodospirillaceae bacterium]